MKKLIVSILLIVVVLAALLVAPQVVGEKGYVLISMGSLVIEMTVVSLVISVLIGLLVLWVIVRFLRAIKHLLSGSWQWFGSLSRNKRRKKFYRAIQAYAEGELEESKKAFQATSDGDFDGVNFLIAAQVAHEMGEWDRCQTLLSHAADYDHSRTAAILMHARLLLVRQEPSQALKVLETADENAAEHPQIIKMKAESMASLGHWQQLQNHLPQWRKTLKNDAVPLAQRAAKGKFAEIASKQGANALKQYWEELPRKKRHDTAFRAAYVQQLIEQGMHHDAQECLVEWQRKGPDEILLPLFRQLKMPNPAASISLLEAWIKSDEKNAELYSILGQVAFNAGDYQLAERALLKAVKLRESPADLMLLAEISERQNDNSRALAFYKQGMAANV
ncbi:heme biosynthesis HemY N-terminal domain-containing protein [Salinimonas chungwhensis]|uniref:heme biosynthesis HemY N-terminal domain-containing protein n=1 Tax=Salinimonas chungwhensis TaxID=265425 RepID=UPI00035D0C15|nr:heme biosynthesis HemY N-terminal domain-containing protein [Salinimonas chungwhensis]